MTYCEMITATKTWTCPKAGRWKIICVGGGASGCVIVSAVSGSNTQVYPVGTYQNAGGTTSFGSILSAAGGAKTTLPSDSTSAFIIDETGTSNKVGGYGGYTGLTYGGNPAISTFSATGNGGTLGNTGIGWGAGGGARDISNFDNAKCYPGFAGELKSIELDLTLNQSIACTVGKGGTISAITYTSGTKVYHTTAGRDGIIIVKFIQ